MIAPALAAAVAAAWLCLAGAGVALGYGTATTYATQAAGTPPGAWSGVAGASSASDGDAAAVLTETDAAGIAPTAYPTNRAFAGSASGWSVDDRPAALCSIASAYDGGSGSPAGSLRATYGALLNLGGLLGTCGTSWTSDAFTWTQGTPGAVAFAMDRAVDVNGLVGSVSVTWSAVLVDETAGTTTVLTTETRTTDAAWGTRTATGIGPSDIVSGHTYHVRVDVGFQSALSLVSGMGFNADNVTLSVTPRDERADGELRVLAVPPGTTHTLELRARTTGEPFDVQVWDGGAWATRATITALAPGWGLASYGLTSAEWNGGTVRLRFVATGSGADAVADALSVEYARVVATGGITVSGPTSVTLPAVAIDGVSSTTTSGPLGAVEVTDAGGLASGWVLTATATRWALDGAPSELLPADALTAAPAAPTTPDGSDMTGVSAGAGGVVGPSAPAVLMAAGAGHGVGTYRQDPDLTLTVPVTALHGTYRCVITLVAS